MANVAPAYRMELRKPRSLNDATESQVLVPLGAMGAAAVHAEPFRVASVTGMSGWRPIMQWPDGVRGRLDVLTGHVDTGSMTVRVMDVRLRNEIDALTGQAWNAERWVTAFLGDTEGNVTTNGCRAQIQESLDYDPVTGTGTWADYFAGRVRTTHIEDDRLWVEFTLEDLSKDLYDEWFVGRPHASITYAGMAPLLPWGLNFSYGALPVQAPFTSTVRAGGAPTAMQLLIADPHNKRGNVLMKDLLDLAANGSNVAAALAYTGGGQLIYRGSDVRVRMTRGDTGASGDVKLNWARFIPNKDRHWQCSLVEVAQLRTDAGAIAGLDITTTPVPASTTCTFVIWQPTTPTSRQPVVVGDVHPVQFFKDAIEGKFGLLDASGAVVSASQTDTGDPGSTFDALLADLSFGLGRWIVTEKAKGIDWFETHVLGPRRIGWRIGRGGKVEVVDLRRPTGTTGLTTITDYDLAEEVGSEDWRATSDGAISRVETAIYVDRYTPELDVYHSVDSVPSYPPSMLETSEQPVVTGDYLVSPRQLDVRGEPYSMSGLGFRYIASEMTSENILRSERTMGVALAAAREKRYPHAFGAVEATLVGMRSSSVVSTCYPGDLRVLAISGLPNAALNLRGYGVPPGGGLYTATYRVARCTARDDAPGPTVRLTFLDLGPALGAAAPSGVSATNTGTNEVTATWTHNAAGDPVEVWVAIIPTGGSTPTATSNSWTYLALVPSGGSYIYRKARRGWKHVFRIRSTPEPGDILKLPSAYVTFAASTLTALGAPTAASVGSITARQAVVTWTNSSTDLPLELLLTTGTSTDPADGTLIAMIPANSTTWTLSGLDPSTTHTLFLRYRDECGFGNSNIKTFTTTGTALVSPRPAGIDIITA